MNDDKLEFRLICCILTCILLGFGFGRCSTGCMLNFSLSATASDGGVR